MDRRDYMRYDFNSVFEISEESPSGIVWKVPRKFENTLKYDRVGKPAGHVHSYKNRVGYWVVSVFGSQFFCHRIVWLLYKGSVDPLNVVDHIDGDSLNNSVRNLREVSSEINSRNSRKNKGKELQAGIYYEELISKRGTKLKRINAHYSYDGKVLKRNFSVLKYGHDQALAMAVEWRQKHINQLNKQGAGYTDRHGT